MHHIFNFKTKMSFKAQIYSCIRLNYLTNKNKLFIANESYDK